MDPNFCENWERARKSYERAKLAAKGDLYFVRAGDAVKIGRTITVTTRTGVKTETLLDLAARCEAATGPDRELDEAISAQTLLPHGYSFPGCAPGFTRSLDAAMTLIPEGADANGERFSVEGWNDQSAHPPHVRASAWVAGARRVYAATPALALCAASLRAGAA